MAIVKSFSVGNGDTFYIQHGSDNFTIIDCNLSDDVKETIVTELKEKSKNKGVTRFISTHPDEDHIQGIKYLDKEMPIINFYCANNSATKSDETESFLHYKSLRDGEKAFYLFKGCSRKWMNIDNDERGSAGINILWPNTDNQYYKDALSKAAKGESANNISVITRYSIKNGASFCWFGDLETEFMENIYSDVQLKKTSIIFAPHHGRKSGRLPQEWVSDLNPKIIVVGEAPSEHLEYYKNFNTIKQNTAGDVTFECDGSWVHVFCSSDTYSEKFLTDKNKSNDHGIYIGSIEV